MRIWLPRALALLALLAAAAAVLLAIGSAQRTGEVTAAQAQDMMLTLAQANRSLGERLDALRPGDSPRQAIAETRAAAAVARRLEATVAGSGGLAAGLRAVVTAELGYLDAVGSTLNNPRSALRGRVGPLAQALRDALQQVPGGDHRAVRGGMNLVAYSRARAGE